MLINVQLVSKISLYRQQEHVVRPALLVNFGTILPKYAEHVQLIATPVSIRVFVVLVGQDMDLRLMASVESPVLLEHIEIMQH